MAAGESLSWKLARTILFLHLLAMGEARAACDNPAGGYEGFGRNATGGAGQPVYRVTKLSDDGTAGTLRAALASGNRCIVFDVGGTITLNPSLLHISSPTAASNITLDGFSAPSPGITIKDYGVIFYGNNVIIRGVRFRNAQGCNSCPSFGNGIVIRGQDVVVDRVSIDGYGDQAMGIGKGAMRVTVQWSIFGEGSDPAHNFPFLVNGWAAGTPGGPETNRVSIHHNLLIGGATRNPQLTWDDTKPYQTHVTADVRNNVIWNFANYGTVVNKRAQVNVIGNYYKRANGAVDPRAVHLETQGKAYTSGNVASDNGNLNDNGAEREPFPAEPVATTDACTAAYQVRAGAGARGPNFPLDAIDEAYIASISADLPGCPTGSLRPTIVAHPAGQTVALGESVVLDAVVAGATTYQWSFNGEPIAGASHSTLVVRNATAAHAGDYTLTATNASGAVTGNTARLHVSTTENAGRIINLAIRSNAGTGPETLTLGAVIGGAGTSDGKQLLLRAVGPSLESFGVTGTLADPMLVLLDGSTTLASNINWAGDDRLASLAARLGAFALAASTSRDAALVADLQPGGYTVQVAGNDGATGIALAEIYDASDGFTRGTPRLVNVSARTHVGLGADILIAGFVIGGSTSKAMLIRGIGAGLVPFGVTGVLADPKLELFSGSVLLRSNDNWAGMEPLREAFDAVGAFGIDAAGKDAALLVSLPPGDYTAQVSGNDGGTGVALVEIYELP